MIRRLEAAAAAVLVTACAAPHDNGATMAVSGADGQSDCFNVNFINSFSEVDRDTARVRVGVSDYYDLHVTPACFGLDWSSRIAVVSRFSSNMCVDRGFGQGQLLTEEDRCLITDVSHAPVRPADGDMTPYSPAQPDT